MRDEEFLYSPRFRAMAILPPTHSPSLCTCHFLLKSLEFKHLNPTRTSPTSQPEFWLYHALAAGP